MKNLFFAIAMIFAISLTSCQNVNNETPATVQDTTQVDSNSVQVDSVSVKADSACAE